MLTDTEMSLQKRVDARERIIHPLLRAVENQVEQWARQSTNGALVWDVATDCLHNVWAEWELVYDRNAWYGASAVLAALDKLAAMTEYAAVSAAVDAAKAAITNYIE